jgi:hypothetical protein
MSAVAYDASHYCKTGSLGVPEGIFWARDTRRDILAGSCQFGATYLEPTSQEKMVTHYKLRFQTDVNQVAASVIHQTPSAFPLG